MRKASEERLLRLARKQFKRCEDFEGDFRKNFLLDVKFANADPDNNWQWPDDLYRNRQVQGRATLTINQVRTLNNMILNEIKKNPPGIVVRATGGEATTESASTYSDWMRETTTRSRFASIVTRAARFQIDGGVGYWRVLTEWDPNERFVQRVKIASIRNMLSVFLDPDAKEPDKSDSKFGFVFEDVLKETIDRQYPEVKKNASTQNILISDYSSDWSTETHYRVAEWYNMEETPDELISMTDPDSDEETVEYRSKIPPELLDMILSDPMTRRRKVQRQQMQWRKIIGGSIVDEKPWAGKYVPLIQAVGDEIIIEDKVERKGNTRLLKDAQRMLNYWMSSGTQHVALQTKVPWMVDLRAIEGYETYYASSNVVDHAYLPYKSFDSEGKPIAPPARIAAPEFSPAYLTGMQIADKQLMTISGQREPTRDMESDNLKSGRAILTRKDQGETSTFGFRDNLEIAVAHTGRVVLDLIKTVYDTPRQIRTLAKDGEQKQVTLDPAAKKAFEEKDSSDPNEENSKEITFNPHLGNYDVDAEAGPDYSTQRQYAVEAMSTVVSTNAELWNVIGDLLVKNMDFPGAEEMAQRMRRTIPKNVLGEGPDVETQQLMEQNKHLSQLLENFTALMAEKNLELKNKDESLTIDVENAITRRIKEVGNASADLKAMGLGDEAKALIEQMVKEAMSMKLPDSAKKTDAEMNMDGANPDTANLVTPPGMEQPRPNQPAVPVPAHPNGKVAPDGKEYVEHSPGKFAMVEPPAGVQ